MRYSAILLSCLIAASLNVYANDKIKLSVFYSNLTSELNRTFNSHLRQYGTDTNISFMTQDAQYDSHKQQFQISSDIDEGDCTLVVTSSREVATTALNKSMNKDKTIIFYSKHPPISIRAYDKAWFVGANDSMAGKLQAEMIKDYFISKKNQDKNRNKMVDYILLRGEKNTKDANDRTAAMISAMLSYGYEMNPVSEYYADWRSKPARLNVTNILKKHGPENVEVIIANNDEMALGAIEALQDIGFNKGNPDKYIPVFGIDGISKAKTAIDNGIMTGTVYADIDGMAKACIQIASQQEISEKKLSEAISVPVENHSVIFPYYSYAKFKYYPRDAADNNY